MKQKDLIELLERYGKQWIGGTGGGPAMGALLLAAADKINELQELVDKLCAGIATRKE